ncbi:MAG: hypothetical protein M1541_00705 [Acidobacteria bacterium]|nr:hypothetical protein [Acidobacteriota bacterium]
MLPESLSRVFTEISEFRIVANEYQDGTIQRSKQADAARRHWQLSRRLGAAELQSLREFWAACKGISAFFFYDPYDPGEGSAIGSNYDATGVGTQGRHAVVFTAAWSGSCELCRSNAAIEFIEVA